MENVKAVHGVDVDIDDIPLDDAQTYEVFARGDTTGLFQFGVPGHEEAPAQPQAQPFRRPDRHERPLPSGPDGVHPHFIARKHGQEPVTYEIADMEEYLSDTYGITVYQEQVMLLSQKLAVVHGRRGRHRHVRPWVRRSATCWTR